MQEQNIPIDINTSKLLEWLINRRHCPKDWQSKVLLIREKIKNAIQDMPAHDKIVELLSGTYINYFHCIKIVEILKETEADTKNLFGRYGSQRMKDWLEIIHSYERENLYLAEAAHMIIRNVAYEIPSFKKQIQKLEQTLTDLDKKEADYKKSENIAQSEFTSLCKELDISGQKIKRELVEKIADLPEVYDKIAKKTKSLEKVVEFYSAFVQLTLGRQHDSGCVPMIQYITDKRNTTTYEWKYGEMPLSIVEPLSTISFSKDDDDDDHKTHDDRIETNTIDFGNFDITQNIDFGEDINCDVNQDIDWGDGNVEEVGNEEINYNISLEESGIVVEASGHEGGVASGNEAYTILDNPSTRSDFINQLFELEAFLKLRLYELKADDRKNLLNFTQLQDVSPILQDSSLDNVQSMLDNVQIILSEILDNKVQHLHNIKHSSRYVDVLASSLEQKLNLVKKMRASQAAVQEKRDDINAQISDLQPMLKLVIERTKELQGQIENDISKKYKNRVVRLTGGVNAL